jgi:hypothetical protein
MNIGGMSYREFPMIFHCKKVIWKYEAGVVIKGSVYSFISLVLPLDIYTYIYIYSFFGVAWKNFFQFI